MDFSVHRNRDGMSNWADDSPKSATDAMNRSLSGKREEAASLSVIGEAHESCSRHDNSGRQNCDG